jgi:hypothetical protein
MSAIEHNEAFSGRAEGKIEEIGSPLVQKMAISTLQNADLQNGGFGSQPKFPNSSAIDLLIDLATSSDAQVAAATVNMKEQGTVSLAEAARRVARLTLEKMARGGVYDQLAGGFHRYSVDEYWLVPHFEKMAYDNSELLKNYIHAYRAFGDEEFALIARDIIRWIDQCLSDRKLGGFYASQDADVSLDDDGDYFTWTLDEAAEALTAGELAIASFNYDIGEIGQMQHNVAKNVLHRKREIDAVARRAGLTIPEARALLESAKKKLYAARLERPTPYVDKTIYVAWNALCISAYIEAARALGRADTQAFALKSLDRVLAAAWSGNAQAEAPRSLAHIVAYGEQGKPAERPPAILDDYILLGHAALDAWQTTGEMRYYSTACDLMDSAIDRFYDPVAGGFFDAEKPAEGKRSLGVLGARRKPLQDAPTPAGNPMAAILLLRLHELNGRADYAAKARQTLEAFAGVVEHFSLYAATYALALQRLITPPMQVCIIGNDELARSLEATALAQYAVNKSVVRLTREQITGRSSKKLPSALAETLPHLAKLATSFAVVCTGNACQPPVTIPADLANALQKSL